MSIAIPDPYHQHVLEAWQQLAAGKRPTADSVLQVVRGSKATAVSAMQFFWVKYLPDMLAGRTPSEVPDPIAQLAASMWERAKRLGDDMAAKQMAGERAALATATQAIEEERAGLAAERLRTRAAIGDVQAKAARDLAAALTKERSTHEAALRAERKRYDDKDRHDGRSIESLEKAASRLRANQDELRDALRAAERQLGDVNGELAVAKAGLTSAAEENKRLTELATQRHEELQQARSSLETHASNQRQELEALANQYTNQIHQLREAHAAELDRFNQHHETAMLHVKLAHDATVTELKKVGKASAKTKR